jgi:hypothetical protein
MMTMTREAAVTVSYDVALQMEADAKAQGRPTPRAASEVLIAETSRRQAKAAKDAANLLEQLREREMRAQALPDRDPDKLGYGAIAELTGRTPMPVKRHLETWAKKHPDKIPDYGHQNGQPEAAPAG